MLIKYLEFIKYFLKKIFFTVICFFLFIKNFLLLRKLIVREVYIFEKIVFENGEVNLFWNASGCHKIEVKNIGVFRGNSRGITFHISDASQPVEIGFYGIKEKISKSIPINGKLAEILDPFIITSKLPMAIETSYFNKKVVSAFEDSVFKVDVNQPNLKADFREIYFEFDFFERENYEPLDITQL